MKRVIEKPAQGPRGVVEGAVEGAVWGGWEGDDDGLVWEGVEERRGWECPRRRGRLVTQREGFGFDPLKLKE